jgi:hypothetical protein
MEKTVLKKAAIKEVAEESKPYKAITLERKGMLVSVVELMIKDGKVISRTTHVEDLPAIAENLAADLLHDEMFK